MKNEFVKEKLTYFRCPPQLTGMALVQNVESTLSSVDKVGLSGRIKMKNGRGDGSFDIHWRRMLPSNSQVEVWQLGFTFIYYVFQKLLAHEDPFFLSVRICSYLVLEAFIVFRAASRSHRTPLDLYVNGQEVYSQKQSFFFSHQSSFILFIQRLFLGSA